MGRRSRKRRTGPVAPVPAPSGAAGPHAAPRDHRARMAEAPKAPWSPFPLVELCVLVALVLIVLGFVTHGPQRGAMLACGVALASVAGLERALRDHFAGFRSRATLLSGSALVI